MNTVQIAVDWTNEKSIESAEKLKFDLECDGYKLINQFGGMFYTTIIMAKIKEVNKMKAENKQHAMQLLVDGSRGVYAWQYLADAYDLYIDYDGEKRHLQTWLDNEIDYYSEFRTETTETLFNPDNEQWLDNVDFFEDKLFILNESNGLYYRIEQIDGDIWAIHPNSVYDEMNDTYTIES